MISSTFNITDYPKMGASSNTGVGVQVVDLIKAQSNDPQVNPVVGVFSTSGQGYGMPVNLTLGKGDQLFVTTGSGKLLLLDIKSPAMPMVISEYIHGGGINDIAYAPDYKYVDSDQQLSYIDLALITTRTGQLYTVDYSDAMAPKLMAQVLDDKDQPVIAYARDLAISAGTGTAVLNTFSSFVILDLRDPYHPRLLQNITTDGNEALGSLKGMTLSNGWVFVANERIGLRTVNLDQTIIIPVPRYIIVNSDGTLYRKPDDSHAGTIDYILKPSGYQPAKVDLVIYKKGGDDGIEVAKEADSFVTDDKNTIVIPESYKVDDTTVTGYNSPELFYGEVVIDYDTPGAIKSEKIPLINQAVMIPDYNRDRVIDDKDRLRAMKGETFYFWVNDDDDQGETTGTDIPGSKLAWADSTDDGGTNEQIHNFENTVVDGVRDLVDFFPVQFDLKNLFDLYPVDKYSYRLTTGGDHLNFVFTEFTADHAGYYLTGKPMGEHRGQVLQSSKSVSTFFIARLTVA